MTNPVKRVKNHHNTSSEFMDGKIKKSMQLSHEYLGN